MDCYLLILRIMVDILLPCLWYLVDREGGGKSTWLEGSSSSRMVVEGICVATKLDL